MLMYKDVLMMLIVLGGSPVTSATVAVHSQPMRARRITAFRARAIGSNHRISLPQVSNSPNAAIIKSPSGIIFISTGMMST